jgi:hypothetical protein
VAMLPQNPEIAIGRHLRALSARLRYLIAVGKMRRLNRAERDELLTLIKLAKRGREGGGTSRTRQAGADRLNVACADKAMRMATDVTARLEDVTWVRVVNNVTIQ